MPEDGYVQMVTRDKYEVRLLFDVLNLIKGHLEASSFYSGDDASRRCTDSLQNVGDPPAAAAG
jgi:hypothetical protein